MLYSFWNGRSVASEGCCSSGAAAAAMRGSCIASWAAIILVRSHGSIRRLGSGSDERACGRSGGHLSLVQGRASLILVVETHPPGRSECSKNRHGAKDPAGDRVTRVFRHRGASGCSTSGRTRPWKTRQRPADPSMPSTAPSRTAAALCVVIHDKIPPGSGRRSVTGRNTCGADRVYKVVTCSGSDSAANSRWSWQNKVRT